MRKHWILFKVKSIKDLAPYIYLQEKSKTMELRFFEFLSIITIFQLVFFAIFLLTLNKGNKLSNRILAVFLFVKAMCYGGGLVLRFGSTFIKISPHFFSLAIFLNLCWDLLCIFIHSRWRSKISNLKKCILLIYYPLFFC